MMFTLAENKNIGDFLRNRIDERYESHRQFCRKYLEKSSEQTDPAIVTKLANRLSQILKGEKEIQLRDIPLFCELLEVSCEDILSAGESRFPASSRLTNYAIAFSKDERDWEDYVTRKNSPILNADEYGKTVIDYALEAANYELLKYLMDKEYICIEKASFPYHENWNVLDTQLKMRDDLRTHMIALAIQHKDMEMLKDAIRHNQYVYDQLTTLFSDAVQYYRALDYDMTNAKIQNHLAKEILGDLYFYDDGSLVCYFAMYLDTNEGLRSNIIRVNAASSDTMINRRISELNGLYDAIHHITPKF